MSSSAAIGRVNSSGKNPSLSFHQIPSNKRKEIRQEWLRRIKRGQNEKHLLEDSILICKFYQLIKSICRNIHRNKPC